MMKKGRQSTPKQRKLPSVSWFILSLITFLSLGFLVDASGILILNPQDRSIHQRHQVYKVKKFLHLSHRDHPMFHSTVGLFLGDKWNRKFCFAAHQERKNYEESMIRRTFQLKHRTATTGDIEPLWTQLKLRPYSRFWVHGESKVTVVILEKEMNAIETLINSVDQSITPDP